jgi:hypothetical protein
VISRLWKFYRNVEPRWETSLITSNYRSCVVMVRARGIVLLPMSNDRLLVCHGHHHSHFLAEALCFCRPTRKHRHSELLCRNYQRFCRFTSSLSETMRSLGTGRERNGLQPQKILHGPRVQYLQVRSQLLNVS